MRYRRNAAVLEGGRVTGFSAAPPHIHHASHYVTKITAVTRDTRRIGRRKLSAIPAYSDDAALLFRLAFFMLAQKRAASRMDSSTGLGSQPNSRVALLWSTGASARIIRTDFMLSSASLPVNLPLRGPTTPNLYSTGTEIDRRGGGTPASSGAR